MSTNMNTNMNSTMKAGAERAERSEASEAPAPYTDMNTDMNVNMISTMQTGAKRAERSEASEAPPLYTDISTNMNYQTPLGVWMFLKRRCFADVWIFWKLFGRLLEDVWTMFGNVPDICSDNFPDRISAKIS